MMKKLAILVLFIMLVFGTFSPISVGENTEDNSVLHENNETSEYSEVKNKTFYMSRVEDAVDVGYRTTKEMIDSTYPVGAGNKTDLSYFRVLVDWHLFPTLAGELTLDGPSSLTVWARSPQGGNVDMTYRLTEIDPDGEKNIVGEGEIRTYVETEWSIHEVPISIDNHTASEGSTLMVTLDIWGDAFRQYEIAYGGYIEDEEGDPFMADTNVTLPCLDYIQVSDVYTKDSEGNVTDVFHPEAPDKNITIHANLTNPFGGYDINWVNLTLEGPDGELKLDNVTMEKTYGEFNSYESRYKITWNYSGEPEGVYQITVRGVDNNGIVEWNSTGQFGGHDVYGYHSFLIGDLDFYVNIKVVDDLGIPLEDTKINLKLGPHTIIDSRVTDSEGIANFTVANVTYHISVFWQDSEVTTNRTLDVGEVGSRPRDDPFEVKAAIFYSTITILDAEDEPIEEASVYITHPNGTTSQPPLITKEDGTFSLDQTPEGLYSIEVWWKGREVGIFEIAIDWDNIDHSINTEVYHLDVLILSDGGQPLPDAFFVPYYNDTLLPADSLISDGEGRINTRLPGAEYLFEISWNDARVYQDTYHLDSSQSLELTVEVFDVEIIVWDDLDEPNTIEGVDVTAIYEETGREIGVGVTDQDGNVVFQLAEGGHILEARWLGVEIASEIIDVSRDDRLFDITASVYELQIQTLDQTPAQNVLSDSIVSVQIDGTQVERGRVDEEGYFTMRLPQTIVEVEVQWRGIKVYSGSLELEDNTEEKLLCDVYQLGLTVTDSSGENLDGAEVLVRDEEGVTFHVDTVTNGHASFRLPIGEWTVETYWRDQKVGIQTFAISEENINESIEASVHNLEIFVTDRDEEPLKGAEVILYDSEGNPVAIQQTDKAGRVGFIQLPEGDYEIRTRFKNTYLLSEVNQEEITSISLDSSKSVSQTFEDFPLPFYTTNLFFVVIVLMAVVIAGILVLLKKKEVI